MAWSSVLDHPSVLALRLTGVGARRASVALDKTQPSAKGELCLFLCGKAWYYGSKSLLHHADKQELIEQIATIESTEIGLR